MLLFCSKADFPSANLTSEVICFNEIVRVATYSTNACELSCSKTVRSSPFKRFCSYKVKHENFSRSKVHFPDLEVCCDWSTFFSAQVSGRSWGRNAWRTPQNVCMGGYHVTSYELTHYKKIVQVWKTKSLLFCLGDDPLIVLWRQNRITFIFIKMMSHAGPLSANGLL